MFFPLYIFYRFMLRGAKPTKAAPVYHKTWADEVPGYPASSFVKNL